MNATALSPATSHAGPELGFRSLRAETDVAELPLSGSLPGWLCGTLLRNGPALYEAGERTVRHWFDGMAMLHRFTIDGGRVAYANRFLRTRAYRSVEAGRIGLSEFATDPCRGLYRRLMTVFDPRITDNAAVSITRLGERYLGVVLVREVEVDAAKHSDTALELLAHSFRGEVRPVDCDARFGLNESVRLRVRLTPRSHDAFAVTAGVDVRSVDDLCALG